MLGIDGNAIDMATVLCGFVAIFVRPIRGKVQAGTWVWDQKKSVTAFLNGAALVPFAVLALSVFWRTLIETVLTSKSSLALAGGVGLLFVLGEILGAEGERKG